MMCVLRFAVVEAVGAAADSEDRRRLNALGNRHAAKQVPPAFEVSDEILCCWEVFCDEARFAAEVLFDGIFLIPRQEVFRRRFLPALDERAEQVIVIRVLDRIPFSFVDVLCT